MGLLHASHVSSVLYAVAVEEKTLHKHHAGLLYYARYHDDILSIHDSREHMYSFWRETRACACSIFRIVVEETCRAQGILDYLDLTITFTVPSIRIEAKQDKPVTPLCPTSCHLPNVHRSWPATVCSRVHTISDSKEFANLSSHSQVSGCICTSVYHESFS